MCTWLSIVLTTLNIHYNWMVCCTFSIVNPTATNSREGQQWKPKWNVVVCEMAAGGMLECMARPEQQRTCDGVRGTPQQLKLTLSMLNYGYIRLP